MPVSKLKVMAKLYWKLVQKIINTEDSILACVLLPNARIIILSQATVQFHSTQDNRAAFEATPSQVCLNSHENFKGHQDLICLSKPPIMLFIIFCLEGKSSSTRSQSFINARGFFARTAISRNILPNELRPWKKSN